jgi:hypothetical protein
MFQGRSIQQKGCDPPLQVRSSTRQGKLKVCDEKNKKGRTISDLPFSFLKFHIDLFLARSPFSGNILFVPFFKGFQRGKNTSHIYEVDPGFDAVAPMVFAKILAKELIDMAG